jgi:hypothetical protein
MSSWDRFRLGAGTACLGFGRRFIRGLDIGTWSDTQLWILLLLALADLVLVRNDWPIALCVIGLALLLSCELWRRYALGGKRR